MPDSRDVFLLRREGQHQEALDLARTLFLETPQDVWLIRAYGWCLHDTLKKAQEAKNEVEMKRLVAEFARLDISKAEDDQSLLRARENWRGRVTPEGGGPSLAILNQKAKVQSEEGNHQEALRILREAVSQYPDLPQASTSLAWEIVRTLKDIVTQKDMDNQAIRSLLREYGRLYHIEKPSPLHSLVLLRATQAGEHFRQFISFMRWWDPANLRAEDYQRFRPAGAKHSYDCLVERVIKALHKSAKTEQDSDNIRWAAEFVGEQYSKFPEQDWFEYYYGKLLVKTGELERARKLIVPIVRRKLGEFWAWDNLASTYKVHDDENQLACLCRALMCQTKDESYLVNVHVKLGGLLVQLQMFAEAKFEIEKSASIREANGWKQSQAIHEWQGASWYQTAATLQSNESLYVKYVPIAEALLNEGLPVVPGVVVQHLPARDDKAALVFVGYVKNSELVEIGVKTDQFVELKGASQGQPLSLQIAETGTHQVIVSVQKRTGEPWDIVPVRIGVVRHVNPEKGVSAVAVGRSEFCLFHHDRFPEMAEINLGKTVAVKVRRDKKRNILRPLAWELTDRTPCTSFCKRFEGSIELNGSGRFGFVDHEIYVPFELIDQCGLENYDFVRGLAISELNKKKNEYGWRALTLD